MTDLDTLKQELIQIRDTAVSKLDEVEKLNKTNEAKLFAAANMVTGGSGGPTSTSVPEDRDTKARRETEWMLEQAAREQHQREQQVKYHGASSVAADEERSMDSKVEKTYKLMSYFSKV